MCMLIRYTLRVFDGYASWTRRSRESRLRFRRVRVFRVGENRRKKKHMNVLGNAKGIATMRSFLSSMMRKRNKLRETLRGFSSIAGDPAKLNMVQEAALDERCILVDELDRPLGEASKRHCHLVDEHGDVPLHRAFSVFLFDTDGNLLLQKRASTKITFPGHYTNSCCSHPLARIPGEAEEHLALGIKRAAQRRLHHELGIPKSQASPEEFTYLTRIHYHSPGDGKWGEHEIDYVLFLQKHQITLDPNPDEISEIRWVSKDSMQDFVESVDAPLTPWFHLMLKHRMLMWWDHLDNLEKMQDHASIQRFN